MARAPDPRLGSVLRGKWRLEHLLGSGGMGSVYVATHSIGRRDAIKILHPEAAQDPMARERFRREAEAVNRFVHPGVVEIRDIDETEDGCPFLVMELLDGQSLSDRVRAHGYPPLPEVLHIATALLDVLAAAHAQGIVHRDIKPANLFLLPDGRLKVLDFGVAQVRSGQPLTRLGTRLGTVAYMPPEQVRGQRIDARADLFAVGATMFRMIAQRPVHEAESNEALVTKMATLPAPALATVAPHAPESVCRVVDRALQFDADARYPNALTMRDDLRAVVAGYPPPFACGAVAVGQRVPASPVPASVAPVPAPVAPASAPVAPIPAPVAPVAAPVAPMPAPVAPMPAPVAPVPARPMPAAAPMPGRAPWVSEASSVLTEATAWTQLTPPQRRTRWALLAFPLIGLLGVVLAFQWMVHRDVDDAHEGDAEVVASRPDSSEGSEPVASASAEPSNATPASPDSTRSPTAEPAAENCIEAGRCAARCKRNKCDLDCHRGTCELGLVEGATLRCKGEGLCEVWCAGECEVECEDAPCRVHCTPGRRCRIEECRGRRQQCPDHVLACDASCDGSTAGP